MIARNQGSALADIRVARTYCLEVLQLKGKWIKWSPMAERVDFLEMEERYIEDSERGCQTRVESTVAEGSLG